MGGLLCKSHSLPLAGRFDLVRPRNVNRPNSFHGSSEKEEIN